MAPELDGIRSFLDGLARRERALLLAESVARGALLAGLAMSWGVVAALAGLDRGQAGAGLALLLGWGGWFAVVRPLAQAWSSAADRGRQARLVEARHPELRGRLVTASARLGGVRAGESDALLALMARRAASALAGVEAAAIHGARRAFGFAALSVGLFVLFLPLLWVAGGPRRVVGWWSGGAGVVSDTAALTLDDRGPIARVGDLQLRFTYPAYTGLEPRVVENGTGDVQAPPGTRVELTARAEDQVEAAGLIAYDRRFEATVDQGRTVSGAFTVEAEAGTYQLVLWRAGESIESKRFVIEPEQDLAPEVLLEAPAERIELALDEPLAVGWRARDDFGVASVQVRLDGRAVGGPLYRATTRKAEVFGELQRTPAELGLKAGAQVKLTVAATDNDTIGGAKVGESRAIEVVVLGARGVARRNDAALRELVDAMLDVLADHLEEAWPPSTRASELAAWSERTAGRYQPLQDLVDRTWASSSDTSLERQVVFEAVRTGGALVRFAAVSFDVRAAAPAHPDDLAQLGALRVEAIEALEDGVLALDRQLRLRALREVVDAAERVEQLGAELAQLAQADEPDALAMLAKLEHLEGMLDQLAQAAAKLDEGGLREFVNAREDELRSLMDEVRRALAEGRMDEAKALLERLAQQLSQLAEGVEDTLERQRGEGNQAMAEAEQLEAELERLEAAQRELQQELQELEARGDAERAEAQAALWDQIVDEAVALQAGLEGWRQQLDDAGRAFGEQQRAEQALLQARQLRAAAQLRDYRGAVGAHLAARYALEAMRRGVQTARLMDPRVAGPGMTELGALDARLERIAELLEQLAQQPASPETAARSQELQRRQQQLEQELEAASDKAEQLSKDFPVRPKQMNERLGEAAQRMGEASEDLGRGRGMSASGSQGAAADRLREAREALRDAMEQASQQQQSLEPGGGGGGDQDGDDGGRDGAGDRASDDPPDVQIPGVEDFRTPEEYQRALLEGMSSDVPEEYRAMKKRYYEELVRR